MTWVAEAARAGPGVEVYRARMESDKVGEHLGMKFWDWGIPTAVSVIEADVGLPVIATGGMRDGIMIAKSIALGASMAGVALPLVAAAKAGPDKVESILEMYIEELKATMFLTGSQSIEDIRKTPVVITGRTREFLEARGFRWAAYAQR